MKSVMAAPSSLLLFMYDVTRVNFENEAVNLNHGVPSIFPEYLISVIFELNISKKTEPK